MLIIFFRIIFYALALVEIQASDVLLELNTFKSVKGELDHHLDKEERLGSLGREDGNIFDANSYRYTSISDSSEHQSLQVFNHQDGSGDNYFLAEMNTERIINQVAGSNQRPTMGNFVQPFILCDFPNPFSTNVDSVYWYVLAICLGWILFSILAFRYF
jgi:hypothetical protein